MTEKTRDTIIYIIASVVCLGMMVLFAIVGRSIYLDKTKDTHLLDNDTQTTTTSTEEKDKVTEIKYVVDDTPLKEYVPEIERETEFADYVSDHDNKTIVMVDVRSTKVPNNVSVGNNGISTAEAKELIRQYCLEHGYQYGISENVKQGDTEAWKRGIGKYPPVELK